jgi:hypothetical protein
MPDTQSTTKSIVVIGDLTLDWNLAQQESLPTSGQTWSTSDAITASLLQGGASLLADLVRGLVDKIDPQRFTLVPANGHADGLSPIDGQYHHSYALWSLCDYEEKVPPEGALHVWRVDQFLGLQRPVGPKEKIVEKWKDLAAHIAGAGLIIVDDAGLDFRAHSDVWEIPLAAAKDHLPWIILKMARPVAQGELWEFLAQNCAEHLVVVIPVNDLRLTQTKISRELSWERTAEDLAWELRYSPELQSLSRCACVVVSFDGAGALLFSKRYANQNVPFGSDCTLFFDPRGMEGMWTQNRKGGMIGYTSCLVAAIAHEVLVNPNRPQITDGIRRGLSAMQTLHKEGYGKSEKTEIPPLAFPTELIVKEILGDSAPFTTVEVPTASILSNIGKPGSAADPHSQWTILQQRCAEAVDPKAERYRLAQLIVEGGLKATLKQLGKESKDFPLSEFGRLLTVDRREIEGFRSIGMLIREYIQQAKVERPLSLAVFGAPGSGKSFGISEVAKSVSGGEVQKLTFNLSQFNSPDELLGAFHQVRDVVLSGQVPLVFWDEFDSKLGEADLGWLRYFLAPMQDGTFQEGEITHPIGRAIFVFAGGTKESREQFELGTPESKAAKLPDFFSRLKGHLRILGPNPDAQDIDHDFIIRRAILLRSFLERAALQIFTPRTKKGRADLDAGVLRAFLTIPKYLHGARSMESIVAMSSLLGKNRFERSSLPPIEQLDLHVNGQAFLALVQQIEFDNQGRLLEELAKNAHEVYAAELRARGENAPYRDYAYENLPEEIKEQNRDQVKKIRAHLELADYVMIPARMSDPLVQFTPYELDLMAENEHVRWMELKVENGWTYGERDEGKTRHPDLLPWRKPGAPSSKVRYSERLREAMGPEELSEDAKNKDRDVIRNIPKILGAAGYTIVKVGSAEDAE